MYFVLEHVKLASTSLDNILNFPALRERSRKPRTKVQG